MVILMSEVAINVKLKGNTARLAKDIIKKGYSESKGELVRNSIIFYAMKLGLISPKTLHKEAMEKIKASGIKYTYEEIREQIEEVENE
ncbi:MAG: hypothetical protein HY930_02155 [Euryarchaeota archaeon]|nr:hypothetical protein [Euryarchaeota archaeon]